MQKIRFAQNTKPPTQITTRHHADHVPFISLKFVQCFPPIFRKLNEKGPGHYVHSFGKVPPDNTM